MSIFTAIAFQVRKSRPQRVLRYREGLQDLGLCLVLSN